jgi:hypothetical protein
VQNVVRNQKDRQDRTNWTCHLITPCGPYSFKNNFEGAGVMHIAFVVIVFFFLLLPEAKGTYKHIEGRQCTYNVILRRVELTPVAVTRQ